MPTAKVLIGSAFLGVFSLIAACSSDSDTAPGPSTPDGGVDANGGGDSATADAAACRNIGGLFSVDRRNCSDEFAPVDFSCIRQTGCNIAVFLHAPNVAVAPPPLVGTIDNTSMKIGDNCTGIPESDDSAKISCKLPTGATCDSTSTRIPLSDVRSTCCDVTKQDECAADEKCTLIATVANAPGITACMPITGSVGANAPCTRAGAPPLNIGRDDCARGLVCSASLGATAEERICLPLCKAATNCADGTICSGPFLNNSVPAVGNCIPRCQPFGTSCAAGLSCTIIGVLDANGAAANDVGCVRTGQGGAGAACTDNSACLPDHVCKKTNGVGACAPMCDATHPCTDNTKTCLGMIQPSGGGAQVGSCQ